MAVGGLTAAVLETPSKLPWFTTRVTAFVSYLAIVGSVVYGLLLSTKFLGAPIAHRPSRRAPPGPRRGRARPRGHPRRAARTRLDHPLHARGPARPVRGALPADLGGPRPDRPLHHRPRHRELLRAAPDRDACVATSPLPRRSSRSSVRRPTGPSRAPTPQRLGRSRSTSPRRRSVVFLTTYRIVLGRRVASAAGGRRSARRGRHRGRRDRLAARVPPPGLGAVPGRVIDE